LSLIGPPATPTDGFGGGEMIWLDLSPPPVELSLRPGGAKSRSSGCEGGEPAAVAVAPVSLPTHKAKRPSRRLPHWRGSSMISALAVVKGMIAFAARSSIRVDDQAA
jgi:hypothetical protein